MASPGLPNFLAEPPFDDGEFVLQGWPMMERRRRDLRADPGDRSRRAGIKATPKPKSRRAAAAPPAPPHRRSLGRRWWHWAVFAVAWGFVVLIVVLAYFWMTLPPINNLTMAVRQPSVTILGRDGSLIATFGDLYGKPVQLKDLPPSLSEAVIATEDRRFYYDIGIDPIGILRAAFVDLKAGHIVQGGSTITQQLAKNLFLSPDRTWRRKIQEALLALWLDQRFTKNQILEIYLNRVYFGAGAYGVDAAAHRYFNEPASKLTLYQSAIIAGLLKAPTRFSPINDKPLAEARANQVLDAMVEVGYITPAQEQAALASGASQLTATEHAQPGNRYFADWIYQQIPEFAGIGNRDLVITTTLDPRMQAAAEAAVTKTLAADGTRDHVGQGALVAMSPGGAIRAMVGGRDYNASQFNRATQALRQPGSAFKAILYAAALQHGLSPYAEFDDHPIRIGNWEPHDYDNHYRGEVNVAEAIADSINTVAAQVIERTGVDRVIHLARRLGITSNLAHNDSLALGSSGVTLIELTGAYAAFANGGTGVWPYGVVEIRDSAGHVVYRRHGSGPGRVLSPQIVGEMNHFLAGVIAHGTGRAARIGRPAAGKTGTTQDFHDALFVGYTANLVTGVWFGNDDNSPMRGVTGGLLPARTWHDFMMAATRGLPVRPLPGPAMPPQVASRPAAPNAQLAAGSEPDRSGLQRLLDHIFGRGRQASPTPSPTPKPYRPPAGGYYR
ncbi:MAG: transglycosylase domain-containing protein [Stellaceae bacterium]